MKVKDLMDTLKTQNPDDEIVMKNLYCNPVEPRYVMKKIRVYKWKERVIIDGYDKVVIENEN